MSLPSAHCQPGRFSSHLGVQEKTDGREVLPSKKPRCCQEPINISLEGQERLWLRVRPRLRLVSPSTSQLPAFTPSKWDIFFSLLKFLAALFSNKNYTVMQFATGMQFPTDSSHPLHESSCHVGNAQDHYI